MKPIPKIVTIGDKYRPAMEIKTQAEADAYFERLVEHNLSFGDHTREQAVAAEKANLGYFAGYYDEETRRRVERLFMCAHPIFGSIAEKGVPTPEQAFLKGVEITKKFSAS